MDYGGILTRAWQITWRRKGLWILGFLVALSTGLGAGTNYRFRFGGTDLKQWFLGLPATIVFDIPSIVLVALGATALVALCLWLAALAPRAALIAGVQQDQDEGNTTLARAWQSGSRRFWTVAGIGLLSLVPVICLVLIGAGTALLLLRGHGNSILNALLALNARDLVREALPALVAGVGIWCGAAVLSAILEQIRIFAERAALLEGFGAVRAFRHGWAMLRDNLSVTVVFWLLLLLVVIIVAAIAGGVVGIVVVPLLGLFRSTDPVWGPVVLFLLASLLALLLGALLGSVLHTFISATWTLVYRELSRRVSAPPSAPSPPS